jgi:molybdenum-dependent DNA-binding transcriptional regulator ModE
MKRYSLRKVRRKGRAKVRAKGRAGRHVRVPAFAPVPLRARADGWTPWRQAAFLGALAETGAVEAAARKVGMTRETAYRLRRRPGAASFSATWDAAVGRRTTLARKVTAQERAARALEGLLKVRMYAGRHVATERKYDNSALLGLLGRLGRHCFDRPGSADRPRGFTGLSVSSEALSSPVWGGGPPQVVEGTLASPQRS